MQTTILFALTTCTYCQNIKKMIDSNNIDFTCIELDLLFGQERRDKMEELEKYNPARSFPTTVIGDRIITGYRIEEIKAALGIRSDIDILREQLGRIHQKKGYYLNRNEERTRALLQGLQSNRERYGYTACPCRLSSGDRKLDRDIICPCIYREQDVKEYGVCYCGLYVAERLKNEFVDDIIVPERRK